MDKIVKYSILGGGVLATTISAVLIKNYYSEEKVNEQNSVTYMTLRGERYKIYGNVNKKYRDGNTFLALVKNNNNWLHTFCSDSAGVCIVMNENQFSRAKYLQAVRSWLESKTGRILTTTSGIRNIEIARVISGEGLKVASKTDHSYGTILYPKGQGALDFSIPHGSAGLDVYRTLYGGMRINFLRLLYQAIYYPSLHFIHIGFLGNRNIPSDIKRFLAAEPTATGWKWTGAVGKYV